MSAVRIFWYNWPAYCGAVAFALVALAVVPAVLPALAMFGIAAATVALGWAALSLLVSHWVYDRSSLVGGRWLADLVRPRVWASVDAGLDAEVDLTTLGGTCAARLDMFDATVMTAPSIRRARKRTARVQPGVRCKPETLALASNSCDAIVVAFAAHELRDARTRELFFDELHRALAPHGRVILVEHVRDWANFAAFGPGVLHFQSRVEWLRLAAHAHLKVADERRITPFVMVLTVEKSQ